MTAKPLMIQGTMSNVGKSLLVAGLARVLVQDGYSVAPFKSQNMALNSFVTADGREMGRAQAMQAQAAGLDPVSDMNPILLKPEGPRGSQVIVDGLSRGTMSARDYFAYRRGLAPQVEAAYRRLARTHDIVLIEGAGSPAEINLQRDDIVNMGMARMVDSPVLLVGDIDPGGVFAQLAGTVALVPQEDRRRIRGLIINKFRGDVSILRPGLAPLEELCGAPVLGVVPYARLDIDDEDSLSPRLLARSASRPIDVAVVRLPHLSNFTDFDPLARHGAVGVRYVERARDLGRPDLVVLPGTKSTLADLAWLRRSGIADCLLQLARASTPVLGVCGGFQMLGEELRDPDGIEGAPASARGLGLLPVRTVFEPAKTLERAHTVMSVPDGFFSCMDGLAVHGYEIHAGATELAGGGGERVNGTSRGDVMGTYLHGLFDSPDAVRAVADALLRARALDPSGFDIVGGEAYRDAQFDKLADVVRAALDMDAVMGVIERGA